MAMLPMHTLKRFIRKALRKQGYDIISFPYPEGIPLGGHLFRVFSQLEINCVIDVGAHYGEYGSFLRRIGYEGWIISFEPISANFRLLGERSGHDPRWVAHRLGLGERSGTSSINVTTNSVFSSFLPPNAFAAKKYDRQVFVESAETVSVRRLDEIFEKVTTMVPAPRVFLKMDTQGWDMKVLDGVSGHLNQIQALQSEVSVFALYEGMTDYLTAMQAMAGLGFVVTGLFPVERQSDGLRSIEFDCVMVRNKAPQ
jgi:FkbM family methyltransferase